MVRRVEPVSTDDLDRVFQATDPAELADRLEGWQREFDRHVEGFDRLQRATSGLQVTEESGGVKVTVDVNGQILDIATTDELDSVESREIGPLVLSCIRRAQGSLAARFAETAKETLGDDDPVRDTLVEQYQQRFPDAERPEEEPAPERGADDSGPIKWDEV